MVKETSGPRIVARMRRWARQLAGSTATARCEHEREIYALRQRCRELEAQLTRIESIERALRESEAHYRALSEQIYEAIVETDDQGRLIYASPRLREVLGYAPQELAGQHPFDRVHPEDRASLERSFRRLVETGISSRPTYRIRTPEGEWRWVQSSGRVFELPDGEKRTIVVTRDVGSEKRMAEALERSEARYRALVENAYDLVLEVDAHGRLLYASPSLRDVLGYDPSAAPDARVTAGIHPEDVDRVRETFRATRESGRPVRAEFRYRHRDGSWRWVEAKGRAIRAAGGPMRWVVISRDVTERIRAEAERRNLEAQVQQAQKLESLGILAGGIAHDFNNLLTSILGYADIASRDVDPGSGVRVSIERIREAGQRAADLTRQLLAYAGRGRVAIEALDLSALVSSMLQLLKISVSKRASLRWELSPDLPKVHGDSGQISQVVLNLITNASDSMGEKDGEITVSTGVVKLDPELLSRAYVREELPEGDYVYMEVRDTGIGMDASTRARIFDPFFTTKPRGRGLGLAAVLGIVRAHGGTILVESESGRGTTFRVLFPSAAPTSDLQTRPSETMPALRGKGTVLLVDDEPDVRSIATRMLGLMGFEVVSASNGQQAVEIFGARPEEIRLVLLDVTMPQMDGMETLAELRRLRGDVPVVLMSGYSEHDRVTHVPDRSRIGFVQKPFTLGDLERALREVKPVENGAF